MNTVPWDNVWPPKLPFYEVEDMPYRHVRLVFPKEWVGTKLPARWEHPVNHPGSDQTPHFLIELLDTKDGKVYRTSGWPFYEPTYSDKWPHDAGGAGVTHLHTHMYLEHYCTCHRKCDARDAGCNCDEDCSTEGDRFVVQAIYAPEHLPGVVLWSENMQVGQYARPEELCPS